MDSITQAFREFHRKRQENFAKAFGVDIEKSKISVSDLNEEQKKIAKGLISENPFERAAAKEELSKAEMTDIEKSDIMDAISYSDAFKIQKTGKEIKDSINSKILPAKQSQLTEVKAKATLLLSDCGNAPTNDVCPWWYNNLDIDCGYKVYKWEETCLKCDEAGEVCDSLSYEHQESLPKINYPNTESEAKARRAYNDTINVICQIMVDIKACEILLHNLKDEAQISMSPRQLVVFKLD